MNLKFEFASSEMISNYNISNMHRVWDYYIPLRHQVTAFAMTIKFCPLLRTGVDHTLIPHKLSTARMYKVTELR